MRVLRACFGVKKIKIKKRGAGTWRAVYGGTSEVEKLSMDGHPEIGKVVIIRVNEVNDTSSLLS